MIPDSLGTIWPHIATLALPRWASTAGAGAGWARARGLKRISRASTAYPSDPMTPCTPGPISGFCSPLKKIHARLFEALLAP
jgi:hypothetical protein